MPRLLSFLSCPSLGWLPPAALLAYVLVFATTRDLDAAALLAALLRNAVSLLLAGTAAWLLLDRLGTRLAGPGLWWHAPIAAGFSLLWLWLLTLAAALGGARSAFAFTVEPLLTGPATEWQLLQGVFAYAALAAIRHARVTSRTAPIAAQTPPPAPRASLLVKVGDDIVSVSTDEIVAITGADDYAELVTLTARHLVRTTLAEFAAQLDPDRFLRVHRSTIVNLARIVRAEPAGGGRMTVHVERGAPLSASRAGARLLREALA